MQDDRRELELRKNGQLARMLGEPLPWESAAEVLELASEDRRQAEEGLVALMRDGEVFYKHLESSRNGTCQPEARPTGRGRRGSRRGRNTGGFGAWQPNCRRYSAEREGLSDLILGEVID